MLWKNIRNLVVGLIASMLTVSAAEAAWPEKPVTLIVPFGAGGGTDISARLMANMIEKKIGKPIVVQNISGAGGTQGVSTLASAKADGYTFAYVPVGTMCQQPHLMRLPYGVDDFQFIGMVMRQPVVVMAGNNAPWKNFAEFLKMVKENPNKYVVGITGKGNMNHTPMLSLAKHFDLKLRFIPYRNAAEVFKDMMAGRTHLFADAPAALSSYDIFGMAQFAAERAANLPDIPTAKECGMDAVFSHWQGVIAPKGIPAEAFEGMEKVVKEVVTSEEFKNEAARLKTNANWMSSADFTALYYKELQDYKTILQENGLIKK